MRTTEECPHEPTPPRPITGRMVLFMMVAFFGVVIGVNPRLMRLAIQTLPGTEVDSAYSASLAYKGDRHRPRPERAQLEGRCPCRAQRAGRRDAPGRGARQYRRADAGSVSRPVRAADRRARRSPVALAESGSASIAAAPRRAPGQWDLVLEGVAAGQRLFLSKNRVCCTDELGKVETGSRKLS